MSPRAIQTDAAPQAIGPYSQGVMANGVLFVAMQIALDPKSGELVGADAPAQIRRCLENVAGVVQAAGGVVGDVVKVTVYLTDLAAFGAVNEAYAGFFAEQPPARAVVEVRALPKGALVAVDATAAIA